jgi:drug/metabolite transporter (DMT)-like permease
MGLTIVFAMLAAGLFGGADFMAGSASRKTPAVVVTALTYSAGLVVVLGAAALSAPMAMNASSWTWSFVSAATGVVGVVTLYAAFGTGRLSIVAPLTAGLAAAGPAAFDLARGARLHWTALAGLVLAIAAVVVVSVGHPDEDRTDMPTKAVAYAVVSGSAFAVSIVALSLVGPAAGMAPLIIQRTLGIVVLAPVALFMIFGLPAQRATSLPGRSTLGIALGAGLIDACATISLLAAIRSGPLAVAAVLGGLYPVGTILLAHFLLGERMTNKERIGVAMALAAVVLIALP